MTDHLHFYLNHHDPDWGSPLEFAELLKQYNRGTPGLFLESVKLQDDDNGYNMVEHSVLIKEVKGKYVEGLRHATLADYKQKLAENTEKYYKHAKQTGTFVE